MVATVVVPMWDQNAATLSSHWSIPQYHFFEFGQCLSLVVLHQVLVFWKSSVKNRQNLRSKKHPDNNNFNKNSRAVVAQTVRTLSTAHWNRGSSQRFSCNAGYQEVGRWIVYVTKEISEGSTLALKPRQTSPEVQNRGTSGPTNSTYVLRKLTKKTFITIWSQSALTFSKI